MSAETLTVEDLSEGLVKLLRQAQRLNEGPDRCRELSLCITSLQEANHWLWEMQGVSTIGLPPPQNPAPTT